MATPEHFSWGIIAVLLTVIGFYTSRWMTRTDEKTDSLADKVSGHAERLVMLEANYSKVTSDIHDMKGDLREHFADDEKFHEEMRQFMKSIIDSIAYSNRANQ